MAKFNVYATRYEPQFCAIVVEAKNKTEAKAKAREILLNNNDIETHCAWPYMQIKNLKFDTVEQDDE